jgi:hypothetical protein
MKRPAALPVLEVGSLAPPLRDVGGVVEAASRRLEPGAEGGGQLSYRPPSHRRREGEGGGPSEPAGSRKVTPETELPRLIGTKSQVMITYNE